MPIQLRQHARAAARAMLHPVWLVVWRRIEARIHTMGTAAGAPVSYEAAWQQHMPAFLNAVSTVGAFGHELARHKRETQAGLSAVRDKVEAMASLGSDLAALSAALQALDARVAALQQNGRESAADISDAAAGLAALEGRVSECAARIEFVRREIFYEMKYAPPGAALHATAPFSQIEPRVLSAEKLATQRNSGLRVNLGCGHIPLDGYVNVDMRALPGVDIVAEAGNLPCEPGTLREIRSAHLLEHFPQEELRRRLLPYWFSLLAPGGTFIAVVPDGEAMVSHLAAGDYPFEQFREVLFGAQEYSGDFHFILFEPRSIQSLLEEAGFTDIAVPVRARRNGACYELEISARKP